MYMIQVNHTQQRHAQKNVWAQKEGYAVRPNGVITKQ